MTCRRCQSASRMLLCTHCARLLLGRVKGSQVSSAAARAALPGACASGFFFQ